jgi:hypothetical protein
MEHGIDCGFADCHGYPVDFLFFQSGLSGHLFRRRFHAIDAVERGLKCVGYLASL